MQSDIWKFPVTGSPAENTRRGLRITHQTGQAQTPSVSPDESEVVYLSDSGGHGNVWVARTDGSAFVRLRSSGSGDWSACPCGRRGDQIVFLSTRPGLTGLSVMKRDGSGSARWSLCVTRANWSGDGRWVYYSGPPPARICIEKTAIEGGPRFHT